MRQAKVGLFVLGGLMALTGCNAGEVEGGQDGVSEAGQELSSPICPKNTPVALKPAANQTLALKLAATGFQIYDCKANATTGAFAWTFRAPSAELKDPIYGNKVGTHYAGPTWEDKWAHSTVVGKVAVNVPSPVPTKDIPWLLLDGVSHAAPKGIFSEITTIQRLNTKGGVAPTTGCSAATAGAVANIPYTSDYFFYRTTSSRTVYQCGG